MSVGDCMRLYVSVCVYASVGGCMRVCSVCTGRCVYVGVCECRLVYVRAIECMWMTVIVCGCRCVCV